MAEHLQAAFGRQARHDEFVCGANGKPVGDAGTSKASARLYAEVIASNGSVLDHNP